MEPTGGRLPDLDVHLERQMRSQERQLAVVRATIAGAALVAIVLFREQLSSFPWLVGLAVAVLAYTGIILLLVGRFPAREVGIVATMLDMVVVTLAIYVQPSALDAFLFYLPVMLGVALRYGLAASVWASVVIAFMYASVVLLATAVGAPARELLAIRIAYLLGLGLAAGLFAVAVQLSFNHGRIVLFVYPITALTLSAVGALGVHYLLVAFEREQVRDVFARFVPEAVVDQVLKRTDADLRLGGVEMEGTVLFTDLRGFTSASEHLPAPVVIELINRHLDEIVDAVMSQGGTLVSYTGDGIMAVFGAPIEQPDHAERAFAAGRDMVEVRLPRWNQWLRDSNLGQGFKMGVGVNSGRFMSGNIGSAQRLAYTAMGDTINTASRIEGMTKGTPYMLFIADSTKALLSPEDAASLVFLDEVDVRGRTTKLKLWALPTPDPLA